MHAGGVEGEFSLFYMILSSESRPVKDNHRNQLTNLEAGRRLLPRLLASKPLGAEQLTRQARATRLRATVGGHRVILSGSVLGHHVALYRVLNASRTSLGAGLPAS